MRGSLSIEIQLMKETIATFAKMIGMAVPIAIGRNQSLNAIYTPGKYCNSLGDPKDTPPEILGREWMMEVKYFTTGSTFYQVIITDDNRQLRRVFSHNGWSEWKVI